MEFFKDEDLENMSTEEINNESRRIIIYVMCMMHLDNIIRLYETGDEPPDPEKGESYLRDYELAKEFLEELIRPAYHDMLDEIHAEVYRSMAAERLAQQINWT